MFELIATEDPGVTISKLVNQACAIDHEEFREQPLLPRAGELYPFVIVDDHGLALTHQHMVFVYEVTEYQVLLEIRKGS